MIRNRINTFLDFSKHVMHAGNYQKLNARERQFCIDFIKENEPLDKAAYNAKVSRLFLDEPNKPKNHLLIYSLLLESNVGPQEEL